MCAEEIRKLVCGMEQGCNIKYFGGDKSRRPGTEKSSRVYIVLEDGFIISENLKGDFSHMSLNVLYRRSLVIIITCIEFWKLFHFLK